MKQAQPVQIPYEKTLKTFLFSNLKKRYNYNTAKNLNFKILSNNVCFHYTNTEINVKFRL